jgi:hypothetical protein
MKEPSPEDHSFFHFILLIFTTMVEQSTHGSSAAMALNSVKGGKLFQIRI